MNPENDFICLEYALLFFVVLSVALFSCAVCWDWNYRLRYAIYIASYNTLIYFGHLHRRTVTWPHKKSNKPFLFVFESSQVRALSTANLTFVGYFIVYWIFNWLG